MDGKRFPALHILLGLAWTQLGNVNGQADCGNSVQLSGGAIAGVVVVDLVLTSLLAVAVYYMASCIHRRKAANSVDLKKSEHESPYQVSRTVRPDGLLCFEISNTFAWMTR
ncbi:hypothetical protein lerEdw1_009978 [Lerista edwardsae]|nr:hypothetical protein lerEdw1_009978 [Lerista edwardsae]